MVRTFLTNEDMEKMEKWISESDDAKLDGDMPENCKILFASGDNQEADDPVSLLTKEDMEEIVQEVIKALGTPVCVTVDKDKNINLSGDLVDGEYTLSFDNADGSKTVIATGTIENGTFTVK